MLSVFFLIHSSYYTVVITQEWDPDNRTVVVVIIIEIRVDEEGYTVGYFPVTFV